MIFYFVLVLLITWLPIVPLNIALALRLREFHWQTYEKLGRPSVFYFVGMQWMHNAKFFAWLWNADHKMLQDNRLRQQIYAIRTSWLGFHVTFVLMVFGSFIFRENT